MSIKHYNALYYNGENFSAREDAVSVEVPLSITINGVPFTVTMQTPGKENELVRGLLFSEGIYMSEEVKPKITVKSSNELGQITAVEVSVPQELILKDFANTRNVISASSCGMCGKTEFEEENTRLIQNLEVLKAALVPQLFEKVSQGQNHFKLSGGTHAAGAFGMEGEQLTIQEDIGRHNAVDKVIGYLLDHQLLSKAKCVTVSGRISFEIVNKTRMAGIPFLAAVSAPSSLAIDTAKQAGITLMAFCRNNKFTVYSNPQNISAGNTRVFFSEAKPTEHVK